MTEWIVSSSVLILVVALVRRLFRGRLSLRLQYALWALVLVRLLVPVSLGQSRISVMNAVSEKEETVYIWHTGDMGDAVPEPAVSAPADTPATAPAITPPVQTETPAATAAPPAQTAPGVSVGTVPEGEAPPANTAGIRLDRVLNAVWLTGMAVMALCLIWSNLAFWLRLRRSRRPLEGADCPLPVYVTGAAETPCLFGLLYPAVYVTPEAAGDGAVLGHVLAHEYTHYRHGDHIWAVLRCLCLAVHWYNPLVWLAASLSRRDAELACDEGTLRRIGEGERLAYGRTLIGLTCTRRGGLLRTATTMTGSKRSIRERITLIAKKPRMAVCTLVAVLLIAAVAAGCTFTGAKQDTPAEWTAMLTEESVLGATVYDGSGQALARLDQESRAELLAVLHGITEEMCRAPKEDNGAEEGQPSVTVYQGLNLWSFRCRGDGQVRLAPSHISSDPGYEVGVEGMVIDCPELYQFIVDCAAAYSGSNTPADSDDEGYAVDLDDVPQTVRQTIEGYVADRAAAMDRVVSEAEITALTRMNTGTASEYNSIELYRLDYRLTFADSGENDGPVECTGYLAFLRELTVSGGQNPVFIGSVDGDELKARFGGVEMLEQYGNIYTAAAMELYQAYLKGQEPGTAAYFQELLKYDGGETCYNGALTCVYAAPEDIALEYVFYNKFPGGEEWHDFTAEEQAYLISQNQDKNFGFGHLQAQKRPAEQLEAMLQRYFGVSLSDVKIPDSWVYYEATDSYYSCHGDFYIMDWLTVTRVVDQGNGIYHIWYTSARSYAQNPATGQTYTDMVLTVRRNAGGGYTVLSNLPASGRGIVLEDADMWPQEAVWEFARVYGAELMFISGYITDYEIIWCEPREISVDGDAVIGFFRCFARPSGSGELMALNGWEKTDDGRWAFDTLFLLERAGGTGKWYCSQWEDVGQLSDYGYEDGMISAIMGNPEVYRCEGDDPYEAALTLMTAYVEDLLVPAEMRSFTITEYRNLSVTLKPTLELDEAEIFNYQPVDGEVGENTWIVELMMEYRWDGVLDDPPYGPSTSLPENYWIDMVHQGSPRGFLLTRNGNEFTLQSRHAVRY
ncbi:MAG: M56 family metallopeptidase [Candidatus Enterenecus sp.]